MVKSMEDYFDYSFYNGKNVLVTGHTGFKGTWLCKVLVGCGAKVTGYSLSPPTSPSIFELSGIEKEINSITGDIRDLKHLKSTFEQVKPEIVFHLAAQPIVRESYNDPVYTYQTNVMGTVNILECVRLSDSVRSFLNITTDKVYKNNEWEWAYREDEPLNGFDPYSNSKSCSELITSSYKNSFFVDRNVSISTARAGNVIGGGDFAADRIIPDCFRAAEKSEKIVIRNPYSTRPYQHVLEPLIAYMMIVKFQYDDSKFEGNYNVGPDEYDCVSTSTLVELFCDFWGDGLDWINKHVGGPHEANFLKLDCSKLKTTFGWRPKWGISEAVDNTVQFYKVYLDGDDVAKCMETQIKEYRK